MWFRLLITCLSLLLVRCGPVTFVVGMRPGKQQLARTTVEKSGRFHADRVAIVDVSGLIYNARKPGLLQQGENPVSLLHEKLEMASKDRRVKAVILRLNTPGGTVTGSDAMYRQVLRFKKRTRKPVVALMMDVAASGGYYLACAADHIVAYPTTITGSVGVVMQTLSVKPALQRLGVHTDAIVTGSQKTAGSPLSELTDEQRGVLQALVDDFFARFVGVVEARRPELTSKQQITDGRIYSGTQAVGVGLVDQTGDLQEAFRVAKQLARIKHGDLVLYHRPLNYVGSPYARAANFDGWRTQINLAQFNFPGALIDAPIGFFYAPIGFFYLWTGGSGALGH